jgi:hypothetical protein
MHISNHDKLIVWRPYFDEIFIGEEDSRIVFPYKTFKFMILIFGSTWDCPL